MQYKAIVSFSGIISMAMGEVREISDQSLSNDLLRAGYIIPLEAKPKPNEEKVVTEDVKVEKPKSKRKGKKDGN